MKTPTAIAVAVVTLGMFAILGWLQAIHVDISYQVMLLPVLLPAIAALFGVTGVKAQTDKIQGQTNGTLTALRAEAATSTAQLMKALALLSPELAASILSGVPIAPSPTVVVAAAPAPAPAPAAAPPVVAPAPAPVVAPPIPTLAPAPAPAAPAEPVGPVSFTLPSNAAAEAPTAPLA